MPSMLGLTTDKSPHAMDAPQNNMQVAARGSGAVTGGVSRSPRPGNKKKEEKNKTPKPPKSTIFGRNYAAAIESETLLWRALCDDPSSALEYIADDAAMINPFFFEDAKPKGKDTEPTLKDALEEAEPWLSYKMHDPTVVEIDLMAVAIMYGVTLFRQNEDEDGFETVEATGASSWRQTAAGEWKLTSMHVAMV